MINIKENPDTWEEISRITENPMVILDALQFKRKYDSQESAKKRVQLKRNNKRLEKIINIVNNPIVRYSERKLELIKEIIEDREKTPRESDWNILSKKMDKCLDLQEYLISRGTINLWKLLKEEGKKMLAEVELLKQGIIPLSTIKEHEEAKEKLNTIQERVQKIEPYLEKWREWVNGDQNQLFRGLKPEAYLENLSSELKEIFQ